MSHEVMSAQRCTWSLNHKYALLIRVCSWDARGIDQIQRGASFKPLLEPRNFCLVRMGCRFAIHLSWCVLARTLRPKIGSLAGLPREFCCGRRQIAGCSAVHRGLRVCCGPDVASRQHPRLPASIATGISKPHSLSWLLRVIFTDFKHEDLHDHLPC